MVTSEDEMRANLQGLRRAGGRSRSASAPTILPPRQSSRCVQKFGTGLRNIDTAACAAKGVKLLTLRRRANISCAEHAFGLMLMLARKLDELDGLVTVERIKAARGAFRPLPAPAHAGRQLSPALGGTRALNGATIGIIGLGEIGREIAVRARAFDMRVLYHQRTRAPEAEERELNAAPCAAADAARRKRLDRAATADRCPRRATCSAAPNLAQIKPGACIVNVANAPIINREALIEALRAGRLGGVALDVHYQEPVPDDDELLSVRQRHPDAAHGRLAALQRPQRFRRADHGPRPGAWHDTHRVILAGAGRRPRRRSRSRDNYPDKPVRIVVPFPAGSATDIVSRLMAQKFSQKLGQQFVVENRPGASGNLGADVVAKSAPDGYTIGLITASTHGVTPALGTKLPYDSIKDFKPISMIGAALLCAGALSRHPGQEHRRAGGARQDQARPAELRLGRTCQPRASRRRAVRQRHRHRDDPRALQELGAILDRHHHRPARHAVRHRRPDAGEHPRRQAARAGDHRAQARLVAAGGADHDGGRRQGLRRDALDRLRRRRPARPTPSSPSSTAR